MIQGEKADCLREILVDMIAPAERKKLREIADLNWLGRNLWINNPQSEILEEARDLMEELGARMVM